MHSDRKAAGHIAKAAGARSLVVDFRRAPEHPYPAQLDDAETAYRWLLSQGYQPQNIGSTGHSIGGTLAVMLPLRLLARGEATPGAIVSISPWTDLTIENPTVDQNADNDKILTRRARIHGRRLETNGELTRLVAGLLAQRSSPQQMRLKLPGEPGKRLGHQSTCHAVYQPGSVLPRPSPLAPQRRSPLRTGCDHRRAQQRAGRRRPRFEHSMLTIHQRPFRREDRSQAGHWEGTSSSARTRARRSAR
jgi:acetyl esterase/lipase